MFDISIFSVFQYFHISTFLYFYCSIFLYFAFLYLLRSVRLPIYVDLNQVKIRPKRDQSQDQNWWWSEKNTWWLTIVSANPPLQLNWLCYFTYRGGFVLDFLDPPERWVHRTEGAKAIRKMNPLNCKTP